MGTPITLIYIDIPISIFFISIRINKIKKLNIRKYTNINEDTHI